MKINVNNIEKLTEVINVVEERAKVRTVLPSNVAYYIGAELEKVLFNKGLPKKEWKGLRFKFNPNAQDFPRAYKYNPEATVVTVERFASGWFVVNVSRDYCSNKRWEMLGKLNDSQEQAILKNFYKF